MAYSRGEVSGSVVGMDGKAQTGRSFPRVGGRVEFIKPVARAGDGGNALGVRASGSGGEGWH